MELRKKISVVSQSLYSKGQQLFIGYLYSVIWPYLSVQFQLLSASQIPRIFQTKIIVIQEIPKEFPLIFHKGYVPISFLSLCQYCILQMPIWSYSIILSLYYSTQSTILLYHLVLLYYSQKYLVRSSITAFPILAEIIYLVVYLPNQTVSSRISFLNLSAR